MPDCPDLSALEGDANKPIRDHIAVCLPCRVVVELIGERRRGVDARERDDECARFEMLLAAREEGTLGGAAGALLEVHLRDCADCQAVAATVSPIDDKREASSLPPVSTAAYALGREVARGGMGRILEALDVRIGRPVAVKELLGKAPAFAARFEREARVTARLQHPGIVPIYEIGKWPDGTPFYTMRMIEGRTLREAMRDKALVERLALLPSIIAAVDAIAFAHGKRIIHRDLTPNNVLVGEYGETVVIDWGLAKDLSVAGEPDDEPAVGPYREQRSASGNLTTIGAVIGTAAYMPPEQASGAVVDERADVYALGAILYHLLAGEPPYRASKSDEVVRQVQAGPPSAVAEVAVAAPRDLVSIVDKAMARDPTARYPTAREARAGAGWSFFERAPWLIECDRGGSGGCHCPLVTPSRAHVTAGLLVRPPAGRCSACAVGVFHRFAGELAERLSLELQLADLLRLHLGAKQQERGQVSSGVCADCYLGRKAGMKHS
jgi:serine/threonine protein kinase